MHMVIAGYDTGPLLVLVVGSVFLTIGDIIAKSWVQSGQTLFFLATLGLYVLGLICLILTFRSKNIAVASLILIILNVVILAIYSWLVYGESLNPTQLAGLVLGLVAVGILEMA